MANYKLTPEIVDIVYGLLSSITVPKYKQSRPSLAKLGEFIVVNSLPIDRDVMQSCSVNVNYYAKDIDGGSNIGYVPDLIKLTAGAKLVLNILEKVSNTEYLIDFDRSETIQDREKEHFIGLRFSFKYINN